VHLIQPKRSARDEVDGARPPLFSIVIPAHNEEALLGELLRSIRVSASTAGLHPDSVQLIVADNASTDATARIAREHGATTVTVPARGIAQARNGGAIVARAPCLCFVDADSRVHPETLEKLRNALEDPKVGGGATGVIVEQWTLPLRILRIMTTPARWMGIDAGVVFCRREYFVQLRGYRDDLLIAEDVDFLWRLRRHARARGQRLVRLEGAEAVTSTRKFDLHGHWRFMGILGSLALWRVFRRQEFLRLVRRYWYEER
jgi:glycosyltransferase involved in cell wall biosynthesis